MQYLNKRTKNKKLAQNGGFSVVFKGKGCNYCMYIKSKICPAYIFIFDCVSTFYLALCFQGLRWQK